MRGQRTRVRSSRWDRRVPTAPTNRSARRRVACSSCADHGRRIGAILRGWSGRTISSARARSPTQRERAAAASDRIDWERDGHAPRSGDGNGFVVRYAEDSCTVCGTGLRHHRLSIEWAWIEPVPRASATRSAVAHYVTVLEAARDAGVGRGSVSTTSRCRGGSRTRAASSKSGTAPRRGPATSTSSPRPSATWSAAGSR